MAQAQIIIELSAFARTECQTLWSQRHFRNFCFVRPIFLTFGILENCPKMLPKIIEQLPGMWFVRVGIYGSGWVSGVPGGPPGASPGASGLIETHKSTPGPTRIPKNHFFYVFSTFFSTNFPKNRSGVQKVNFFGQNQSCSP